MNLVDRQKLQGFAMVHVDMLQPASEALSASFIGQPRLTYWSW